MLLFWLLFWFLWIFCFVEYFLLVIFLRVGGNSWSTGKPPPGMVTARDNNGKSRKRPIKDAKDNKVKKGKQHSGLKGAVIAVILIAVFVVALILLVLVKRRSSGSSHYTDEQLSHNRSFSPLVDNEFTGIFFHHVNHSESLHNFVVQLLL